MARANRPDCEKSRALSRLNRTNRLLRESAKAGDIGGARAALADGATILDRALCLAAEHDRPEVIVYLFSRGARFKTPGALATCAEKALQEDNPRLLEALLSDSGQRPDADWLRTAPFKAAVKGSARILAALGVQESPLKLIEPSNEGGLGLIWAWKQNDRLFRDLARAGNSAAILDLLAQAGPSSFPIPAGGREALRRLAEKNDGPAISAFCAAGYDLGRALRLAAGFEGGPQRPELLRAFAECGEDLEGLGVWRGVEPPPGAEETEAAESLSWWRRWARGTLGRSNPGASEGSGASDG